MNILEYSEVHLKSKTPPLKAVGGGGRGYSGRYKGIFNFTIIFLLRSHDLDTCITFKITLGLLLIQKNMFHENYCFWGAGASQAFDLLHDRNSPAKAGLFRACRVNTLKTTILQFCE